MKKQSRYLILGILSFAITSQAWALMSPTRELPPGAYASTHQEQHLMLLHSGTASFLKRLQLIESARSTIETEFFDYIDDKASRLYTQALVRKAQAGVKVRLLVDQAFRNKSIDRYYAKVLGEKGIDLRFYNDVSILKIKKANHRSHRKSLIIDGTQAIIGGRNMAEPYYEFSSEYNYMDRDVVVQGSIVKDIRQSFENFWTSELTNKTPAFREPILAEYGYQSELEARNQGPEGQKALHQFKLDHTAFINGMNNAQAHIVQTREDAEAVKRVQKYGALHLEISPTGICRETYYYADIPGHRKESRVVGDQIRQLVSTARQSIAVESPFFIQRAANNIFGEALKRGLKVEILTNSLRSGDSPLTIAPFLATAKVLSASGAEVYILEGVRPRWLEHSNAEASTAAWGTHAKSMVLDEDTLLIGSYNMDPRSENFNAEMALVCRGNKELAGGLAYDFELRKSIMVKLDRNGNPVDGRNVHLNASPEKIEKYNRVAPLSLLIKALL